MSKSTDEIQTLIIVYEVGIKKITEIHRDMDKRYNYKTHDVIIFTETLNLRPLYSCT